MLTGNLFKKTIIYFLIFIILIILGAMFDLSAQTQEICLVTVDAKSNKNMILWEPKYEDTSFVYNVLRESSKSNDYKTIGSVNASKGGIFIDSASHPSQAANRYKIEVVNSKGAVIETSNFHQTIHLVLSQGLPGTYNLIWTPYFGFEFETYFIYKGYSKDNLVLYDSLSNTYNQYSDSSDRLTYYQIAVRKASPCNVSKLKSGAEPISHSVSNLEDNLKYVNFIKNENVENKLKVHPNPFNSQLTLELFLEKPEKISFVFYNNLGQTIHNFSSNSYVSGQYKYSVPEKIFSGAGFYTVKAIIGNKTYYAKILKNNSTQP
jgi:hypothetical protein